MMHAVVRMHKAGQLEDKADYDSPGTTPGAGNYKQSCSYVNLAKIHLLGKMNYNIQQVYLGTLRGREARNTVNKMIGDELEKLLEVADDHNMNTKEVHRCMALHHQDPSAWHGRTCTRYTTPGSCTRGDECPFIHVESNRTFNS